MGRTRCIGCDQDFDTGTRRSDVKHCPECEPLRHHRGPGGGRLPVAVLRSLGTACALCGEAIDFARHFPDPLTPSVDHIRPVLLGGSHDPDNLQMAHLGCNQTKHLQPAMASGDRDARQRFYNLNAWRLLARAVRAEEPVCRSCGAPSACASHIVATDEGGTPWDRSNIEALCLSCRNRKAQAKYRRRLR